MPARTVRTRTQCAEKPFADVVTDAVGHADLWFVAAPGIGVRFRASRDKLWTLGKVVAGDERVDIVLQ